MSGEVETGERKRSQQQKKNEKMRHRLPPGLCGEMQPQKRRRASLCTHDTERACALASAVALPEVYTDSARDESMARLTEVEDDARRLMALGLDLTVNVLWVPICDAEMQLYNPPLPNSSWKAASVKKKTFYGTKKKTQNN